MFLLIIFFVWPSCLSGRYFVLKISKISRTGKLLLINTNIATYLPYGNDVTGIRYHLPDRLIFLNKKRQELNSCLHTKK